MTPTKYSEIADEILNMIGRRSFAYMLFSFALSEASEGDGANVLHNALCRIVEVNKRYLNADFEIETEALAAALPAKFSNGMWQLLNLLAINQTYECMRDQDGHAVVHIEIWKHSPQTLVSEWRQFFAKAKAEQHERLAFWTDANKRFEALARVVAMIPREFDISQVEHVARRA